LDLKTSNIDIKNKIFRSFVNNKEYDDYSLIEKIISLKNFDNIGYNDDINRTLLNNDSFKKENLKGYNKLNDYNFKLELILKNNTRKEHQKNQYLFNISNNSKYYLRKNFSIYRNFNSTNIHLNDSNNKMFNETYIDKKESPKFLDTNNVKKIILGISIYFQLFLIISTLSLSKLYEEYFKAKILFCQNKYSYYKVLTPENKDPVLCESSIYIFTSGKPHIIEEAVDEIFDFPKNKRYAKIERIVEIYCSDEKKWKILGKEAIKNNFGLFYKEEGKTPYTIEEMEEGEKEDKNLLEINTLGENYTFPKIFTKKIIGKVLIL